MLLFGHMGLTLGVGILFKHALTKRSPFHNEKVKTSLQPSSHQNCPSANKASLSTFLKNYFDYRFLLVGSLLPDLLDKPIGDIFFFQTFQNGRIFGHTLCFSIFLAFLGIYLYKIWGKPWFLILSFGSAIHLILDKMWFNPQTLLWPAYGLSFAKVDSTNFFGWLPGMFHTLATEASVYIPEVIGFTILVWFAARLIQTRRVYIFITNGLAEWK